MREVTDDKNKKNAMFLLVFVVAATNKKRHAHTHTQKQGRHHKHTKNDDGISFPLQKTKKKNDCENPKNTTQENKVVFFSNEQEIENESKKGLVCAVFSFFCFSFLLSFRVVGLLFF
jgi:hypothetical protein